MIAVGVLDLSDEQQKSLDERLASLERRLEHLKAGLGLLGAKPCDRCGVFCRSSDRGALFHGGELVCYNCIPQWWLQRSPKLGSDDRQQAERDLRRWLVSHHRAEVIGRPEDLPARATTALQKFLSDQCDRVHTVRQDGEHATETGNQDYRIGQVTSDPWRVAGIHRAIHQLVVNGIFRCVGDFEPPPPQISPRG